MAWADWEVQGVLGGFKAVGGFIQQSRAAASQKAWQKYNNALTQMQNAQNQNNITANEGMAVERNVRDRYAITQSEYKTQGQAIAASGAVGAEGNSVDLVLKEVSRNAQRAQDQLANDFDYSMLGYANQRQASDLQTQMQLDHTQIPSPNLATSLLSWGSDTLGKWADSKYPIR
jgi:hypothetical protein